ncbi:glutamate receptor 4-like [Stegodyphus dumicola]|uniref:glutamate receptor 4-like n=1 Tax=Stegodyphus dumicola TaxID=202533 RepID=UPI0015AA4917|nr:glutamate receptor 4-like [Stegodyphus dumicola]
MAGSLLSSFTIYITELISCRKSFVLCLTTPQIEAFWRADNADSAFGYLTASVPSNSGRILLATSETLADELVAKYVARGRNFHFILIRPVALTGQSPNVGSCKLTKFSVVDPMNPAVKLIANRWKTLMPYGRQEPRDKELPDTAIISYDTSIVLYNTFDRIAKEKPDSLMPHKGQETDCMKIEGKILETASFIKEVTVQHAATGKIKFRADGQRSDYVLNILEVMPSFEGLKKIGTWSESSKLQLTQDSGSPIRPSSAAYRDSPPLRVTSILVEPFLKIHADGKYEGYVIDLLEELMKVIGRSYVLNLVKDEAYGVLYDGRWNGMIGELVRGEADLAVAPLTKTKERETAIDFSKSFMLLGLNILLKKPQEEEAVAFRPFSFLTIWPVELWMIILLGVAVFAGTGYGISRFIGAPDRVRALESKGTDNLSPCGSVWFTCGSLLFRDTGIYPRIFTHRVWAVIWWLFCLFLLFAYVSCLSAALIRARTTVTTIHSKKTSQEILMDSLQKGSPTIGTVAAGSTVKFFLNTEIGIYQEFARYLKQNPDVLTATYREGVERVRNSGGYYAYIMESASSEAVANSKPCDTLVSTGFLNTRAYAVGLPKQSPVRDLIDHGILTLTERGILRMLYEKWWYNGSTLCEDPNRDLLQKVYSNSMTLHEVSGVFYLFIILLLVSVAAATVEYYVRTRRISME